MVTFCCYCIISLGVFYHACFFFNRRRNPDCPCDREKLDKEKVLIMSTYMFHLVFTNILIQCAHHGNALQCLCKAEMSLGASSHPL